MKTVADEIQCMRSNSLARLSRTMVQISLSSSEGEILDSVVGTAVELIGVSSCAVFLFDEQKQLFHVNPRHGTTGIDAELQECWSAPTLRPKLQSILEQGLLFRTDTERFDHPMLGGAVAKCASLRALLMAPLISGNAPIGVLVAGNQCPMDYSDEDCDILAVLASHAASAIASVRKLESEYRRAEELAALNEVARLMNSHLEPERVLQVVMEKTIQLTRTDSCAIVLRQTGDDFVIRDWKGIEGAEYARSRGRLHRVLAQEALKTNKVVVDEDLLHSSRPRFPEAIRVQGLVTVAAAPMMAGETPIGTLNIYTKQPHHYSDDQLRILANLAGHAAVAIEKSRLHRESSAITRRLHTALSRLGEAFAGGEDLSSTLEMIPRLALELMNARASGIALLNASKDAFSHFSWCGLEAHQGVMDVELVRQLIQGSACTNGAFLSAPEDSVSDPMLRAARRLGLRSFLSVPIMVGGESIGLLGVLKAHPHHFSPEEVELLATFASQAAVAVEKARLRDQQRHIAETLQRSLLPTDLPQIPGLEVGSYYCNAVERMLVGGDFYDLLPLPDGRWLLAIGDVCGHEIEAAVSTAMDKYALRAYITEDPNPGRSLERLNTTRCHQLAPTEFTTLFCGVYDPAQRTLRFANAGSPPMIHLSCSGEVSWSTLVDPPVGLPFVSHYGEETWQFRPGDLFILYTDGLYEAKNAAGEEFGEERLRRLLARHRRLPAARLAERIFREVRRFAGGQIRDDIALLVFRVQEDPEAQ